MKKNSNIFKVMANAWGLLNPDEKLRLVLFSTLNIILNLLDTIALVGILPVVGLVLDPTLLDKNKWFKKTYELCGNMEYKNFVTLMAFTVVALMILGIVGKLYGHYILRCFGVKCQKRLSEDLLQKCVNGPYIWLANQNSTALSHLIYTDVLRWSNDGIQRMISMPAFLSLFAFSVLAIVWIMPWSGLIGLCIASGIVCVLGAQVNTYIKKLSEKTRITSAGMMVSSRQILAGIKDVKLSCRENFFIKYFLDIYHSYGMSMVYLRFSQLLAGNFVTAMGKFILVALLIFLWRIGVAPERLAAFSGLLLILSSKAVPAMINLLSEAGSVSVAAPHIEGILKIYSELECFSNKLSDKNKLPVIADKLIDKIEVCNISYSYPEAETKALNDVSIKLQKGKSYGIVGASGSGKTTLLNLILGLLEPDTGTIKVDETDISETDKRSWFKHIGHVAQKPVFTDASLKENIAFGVPREEINEEYCMECLKKAHLSDLLDNLPQGLESQIGDEGSRFSGGQLQRIAIARALYRKSDVLVFDEATSALDVISEKAIKETISDLHGEVIVITVAHRLSSLRDYDLIFFLEDGKLLGEGSYDELQKTCPQFQKMLEEYTGKAQR